MKLLFQEVMPVVEEGRSVSAPVPPSRTHNPKASCWVLS